MLLLLLCSCWCCFYCSSYMDKQWELVKCWSGAVTGQKKHTHRQKNVDIEMVLRVTKFFSFRIYLLCVIFVFFSFIRFCLFVVSFNAWFVLFFVSSQLHHCISILQSSIKFSYTYMWTCITSTENRIWYFRLIRKENRKKKWIT